MRSAWTCAGRFGRAGAVLSLTALLGLGGTAADAWAQSSSSAGAVKGVVTDAQGAAVPGARLELTNADTGGVAQQTAQGNGAFVFPLLKPGHYRLAAVATGFSTTTLSNLNVQVASVITANPQLKPGAVTTEVTVTGAAQLVDTSTATTGDVVTGQQAVSIPLPTRNFLDLTGLQTNVTTAMQSAATVGRGSDTVYSSGSRGTTNNYVLDGIDANSIGGNSLASVPIPNPDAIQEFKVSTSLYDASQGRGSGGEINVVLKSGGDNYHGGAFEFLRNSDFNANDFFANRAGKSRPVLQQNQFGGEVGGPVPAVIPELKDTFWFFSYQGTRQKNGISGLISGSQPVLPATRDAASLAAAFAVPVTSIDPVAVKWLNRPGPYGGLLYPSGTCVGVIGTCGPGSIGTFTTSLPAIYNEDQEAASVDHDFNSKHHVAMQWFYSSGSTNSPTGGGVSLGQGSLSTLGNNHLALSDRYILTPTLLNDFRTGFTHIVNGGGPVEGTTVSDIGMQKWDAADFPGTPAVSMSGLLSWGGIGVNSASVGAASGITTGDTLSWLHGAHNVRVGGEWIRYRQMSDNQYGSRGSLGFPNFQSLLTGTPNRLQIDVGYYYRYYLLNSLGGFAQDDWHVSRRLTLNLGARVDNLGFPWEKSLHTGLFDPQLVSPGCKASGGAADCVASAYVAPARAQNFPTPGVGDSGLVKELGTHLSPRLGFAYDVFGNGRMAVRGGYGMYYIQISTQSLLQLIASAPWVQQSTLSGTGVAGSQVLANPWS
ncbi:MAG: TonB-dependent receptor domain-containing protein, partial [Terriglobales bacterium]